MSETKFVLTREMRECVYNDNLSRKGARRGFIYDYRITSDGKLAGWWWANWANSVGINRRCRYLLRDAMSEAVTDGDNRPVFAQNIADLAPALEANKHLIPSEAALAERRERRQREDAARAIKQRERDKKERMEAAAPQMYKALQSLLKEWSDVLPVPAIREIRAALALAEGKDEDSHV